MLSEERRAQIAALAREPIGAASTVGEPVRYDEMFERLQAQMDLIGSLTGQSVDWRIVVELASEILKTKSKDLLVMSYLALGLFETEGYDGLAVGLAAQKDFIATFWDACFPKLKPPQGRYNAVQFLADRVLAQVEPTGGKQRREPKPDERKAVHECAATVAELDSAITTAFSGQPETPNMLPLVRALKALKDKVGPLEAPAPATAPTATAAPAAAPSGSGMGGALPDVFTSPSQAISLVIRIAKYLMGQDNKDARAYRLLRAGYLADLELPRDRFVPGPPANRRTYFENTAASGNWTELLDEAEGQFAVTPLWLDMQRYSALALQGLGAAYKAAFDAVVLEAVALHQQLPQLFELSFREGAGFADGATRAWIADLAGKFGGGGGGASGGGGGSDGLAAAVAEARKLMSEAKGADAVQRMAAQMESSASRRERFRAELALAGFCMDMNKLSLAQPLLEGLERVADQYRLDDWEPELVGTVMQQLYDCMARANPRPTDEQGQRQAQVFARLCRLDPASAFKLDAAAAARTAR